MLRRRPGAILQRKSERIICGVIHFFALVIYLFELFVILPRIYGWNFSSTHKILHVIAGTALLFNWLLAYWMFLLTDAGTGGLILQSDFKHGWFYCWKCETNSPPRSYHCPNCATCVLVRDHHCVLSSNCVGYNTRRYFLLMNLYFWLGLLYANYFNMDYAYEIYHNFSFNTFIAMTLPGVAWFFGLAGFNTFFMNAVTSLTSFFFFYSSYVFYFHMRCTVQGITTHEYKYNKGQEYNLGFRRNMETALGVNWTWAWISPLIPSPLPGNGIDFDTRTTTSTLRPTKMT